MDITVVYIYALIAHILFALFIGYASGDIKGFVTAKGKHPIDFWMWAVAIAHAVLLTYFGHQLT